ncbi:MAG TPA: hypothetical protein VGN95_05310 [Pyrinomonadaceae bacterium]|jgi:hypothetical protein|nr:hypothetical protein [Pyrinomonadaceae bacterium]
MMEEQSKTQLIVVTTATPPRSTMRGAKDEARKLIEEGIPLDKLQRGFRSFMESLRQIVKGGEENQVGDFMLDEITFSAEIGADGEFKLLGTGIGITASSAVSFKLCRQPPLKK